MGRERGEKGGGLHNFVLKWLSQNLAWLALATTIEIFSWNGLNGTPAADAWWICGSSSSHNLW